MNNITGPDIDYLRNYAELRLETKLTREQVFDIMRDENEQYPPGSHVSNELKAEYRTM